MPPWRPLGRPCALAASEMCHWLRATVAGGTLISLRLPTIGFPSLGGGTSEAPPGQANHVAVCWERASLYTPQQSRMWTWSPAGFATRGNLGGNWGGEDRLRGQAAAGL